MLCNLGWHSVVRWLLLHTLLEALFVEARYADSAIYNATYTTLDGVACSRHLDAHGNAGCTSSHQGDTGVLYNIPTQESIKTFETEAPDDKFAIVMPLSLVTKDNLRQLEKTGKIAAIIVKAEDKKPTSFSADDPCPNCEYSILSNMDPLPQWNPAGTSLYKENYSFPIFIISPDKKETLTSIEKGIRHNRDHGYSEHPLYAVELHSFMWATGDVSTCLRRGWCAPVGGYSIYSSPTPMKDFPGKDTIVLASAINGRTFFQEMSGDGVESNLSGLVGLLAVANAFSRIPAKDLKRNILYTLFSGESWGFAGSQRFVKDISTKFECKVKFEKPTTGCPLNNAACAYPCRTSIDFAQITLDQIQAVVELNQIGHLDTKERARFFVHTDDKSDDNNALASLFAGGQAPPVVRATNANARLPPTSAQSFVQARKVPAVVISDYDTEFSLYYNSNFDTTHNENTTRSVCDIAQVTANGLYKLASNNTGATIPPELKVDCDLIPKLFECLSNNIGCQLVAQFFEAKLPNVPINRYSVLDWSNPNYSLQFIRNYLVNATASVREGTCKNFNDCKKGYMCVLNQCMLSYTNLHNSYGAGLEFDSDHGYFVVADASKPTWVESSWDPVGIRMFTKTSTGTQAVELVVGILFTLIAIVTTFFARRFIGKTLKVA